LKEREGRELLLGAKGGREGLSKNRGWGSVLEPNLDDGEERVAWEKTGF